MRRAGMKPCAIKVLADRIILHYRRHRAAVLGTGAVALVVCAAAGLAAVEAKDKPSDAEANATWLKAYESDDKNVNAQALGVTTGIVLTAKSFIPASECPKPKHVFMRTIADETAKVIRADMNTPLVVAATVVWGNEVGCPAAVRRWIERAR
jgi:hypothetical protein